MKKKTEATKSENPVDAEKNEDQEFESINAESEEVSQEEVSKEDVSEEKVAENDFQIENKKLSDENSQLKDENSKLKNEMDALKDRLLRMSAEYENFRKRTSKEKEGIYTDACEDVLCAVFPVVDNLERAYNVQGSVDDLKKGIEMTLRQFNDVLSKLDVEEVPADGQFDPNIHNAVMHIEDNQFENNQIVEVFQKGYKRGNKILRHSMVKVAN